MRIAMIGTGYVGLVSGACFSEFGVSVICVDKDAAKIERLRRGEMPIYEPGLEELGGGQCRRPGRLRFTTDLEPAVARRRCGLHRGRHAVAARRRACRSELCLCRGRGDRPGAGRDRSPAATVVVTKSTVPVGTGRQVAAILRAGLPGGRLRRRLEPGISARGLGDRGFHAARPGRDRRRQRARPRGAAPALPAALL